MTNNIPVLTIDGPSGVGKSTLSKIIADKLNWFTLESGKIYRLIAYLALSQNIIINEKNITFIAKNLDFFLLKKNMNSIYNFINFKKISEVSSQLASFSNVRSILLKKQRLFRCFPGLVAEGRDMGTVVFPDAILKFFLYANLEIRVKRRTLELKKKVSILILKNC